MNLKRFFLQTILAGTVFFHSLAADAQTVTKIAVGQDYSLFVKSDGSLWDMGANGWGNLGNGTNGPDSVSNYTTNPPPQLIVASNVISVSAGEFFQSWFIKSDGSLWGMGNNSYGALGGSDTNLEIELPELEASNVTAVAGGAFHSLFLKTDGSLWAVGRNNWGQLGDGTTNNVGVPEPIMVSNVTAIAAGYNHSLFLKQDGSLWGMGWNGRGQLGDGTTNSVSLPEQIVAGGVAAISAYGSNTLFLKTDGSMWGMGCNAAGQLGDGTYNDTNQPELIVASNVIAIACGGDRSCFLKSDHSLWGMGANTGQLLQLHTNRPGLLVPSGVAAVAAGSGHTLFLSDRGSLWGMGESIWGELGATNNYVSTQPLLILYVEAVGYNQISASVQNQNSVVLTFVGIPEANYVLERSFNLLSGSWGFQGAVRQADVNGLVMFTNTPNVATNNFWRIQAMP